MMAAFMAIYLSTFSSAMATGDKSFQRGTLRRDECGLIIFREFRERETESVPFCGFVRESAPRKYW